MVLNAQTRDSISKYSDTNTQDQLKKRSTELQFSPKIDTLAQKPISNFDDFSNPWKEIGPLNRPGGPGPIRMRGTGRLVFIEFDKSNDRVFTGSPLGGLWYSENLGDSWQSGGTDFLPEIGVSHLQVASNFNKGETWFIATGDGDAAFNPSNGIWRTMDKGLHWEPINFGLDIGLGFPPPFWSRCRKILAHPENGNILYAAFRHGVYKTENALEQNPDNVVWKRVADKTLMTEFFDLAFQPNTNGKVLIVSGDKLAISFDAAQKGSFSLVPNYESLTKRGPELISLRVSPVNPDLIYGAYSGYVFSYSLKTKLTKTIRVGYRYKRSQAFAVSPFNANEFVFGNVQGVFLTKNLGDNYVKKPKKSFAYHDDIHYLIYRDSNEIWMANDGGICRSFDSGDTWQDLTNNIGAAVYYNIGISEKRPDLIIGGGWDTGPNIYLARKDSFQTFKVFGDAFESLIDDTDPEKPIYYVSTQAGMSRFDNSLSKIVFYGQPKGEIKGKRNWTHEFVKDPNNQSTLYYSGMPAIGRSFDKGLNWENIIPNPQNENKARFFDGIWHSPETSGFLYVLQNSKDPEDEDGLVIWKSKNANASNVEDIVWEKLIPKVWGFKAEISKDYSLTDLCINPNNPNHIWISISSYNEDIPKVLEYNGKKWKNVGKKGLDGVYATRVIAQKHSKDLVYLGSHSGVYYKRKDQKYWKKIEGCPHAKITDMEINNCAALLRVATLGRGIWQMDLIKDDAKISVEKNEFWSEDKYISGQIIIKSGVELTIKANLYFGVHGQIILEEGAKLILDGATFSSFCGSLWKGIQINGMDVSSNKKHEKNQLLLKNGAQINDVEFK